MNSTAEILIFMKNYFNIIALLFSLFFISCSGLIEYSIFDTDVKTQNLNIINAARISQEPLSASDTLKFVVFSDSHENYDHISDAIESINKQPDISFIIVSGDITVFGFSQEFLWYSEVIKESKIPLVTLVGNHDLQANGDIIFERLFGPRNMSFTAGGYKFIMFDNTIWENENHSPQFEWLRDELSTGSHNVLFCHLPPYTGEFDVMYRLVYNSIVDTSNTILSVHGQFHYFSDEEYNGIHTVIVNAVDHRDYCIISLVDDKAFVKNVHF